MAWAVGCGGRGDGLSGTGALCVPSNGRTGDVVYVRKSFLVDSAASDPGWTVLAAVTSTTPSSPLSGTTWNGHAAFAITVDEIEILQTEGVPSPLIFDAWPADNVDVTADALCSTTQDRDWQMRDWVGWHFDKRDAGDLGLLYPPAGPFPPLVECAATSSALAFLVPGSFTLDETTATMSWRTTVMTAAVSCPGVSIGALTIELTYSLTRP